MRILLKNMGQRLRVIYQEWEINYILCGLFAILCTLFHSRMRLDEAPPGRAEAGMKKSLFVGRH